MFKPAAQGAAPHFHAYVHIVLSNLRDIMRETLSATLSKSLEKILWPKKPLLEGELPPSVRDTLEQGVTRLLVLHRSELQRCQEQAVERDELTEPSALLPLEIMAAPIRQRFAYHFSGDRPTNRLDKPEYFLSHFFDVLSQYDAFLNSVVQPCLWKAFKSTNVAENTAYLDATTAWIVSLLPTLQTKLAVLVPQVSSNPQLFSHLIHELVSFDRTLRDEWQFNLSGAGVLPWRGLTWEVLVRQKWFDSWLAVEKDFALARYQAIVDDPGASALDLTHNEEDKMKTTKPTKAAVRLHDLLCTTVSTYRPLPSFSQKLRFLIDIHIDLLDRFHERLRSSLEAFMAMTSSIGRTVQGVSAADVANIQGVSGLERLCRIYGAADFLERAMRDWSDDVFFIDLWTELQNRAEGSQDRGGMVAGPLNLSDVATRTSGTLVAIGEDREDGFSGDISKDDTGALFDETATAYTQLKQRAESALSDFLSQGLKDSLRPYARLTSWDMAPVASASGVDVSTISSELSSPLQNLAESLSFLTKALSPLAIRQIAKPACRSMDSILFNRVLLAHKVNSHGARQIAVDVASLAAVSERYLGSAGAATMKRIKAAVQLLNVKAGQRDHYSGEEAEDAWVAEDEDVEEDLSWDNADLWTIQRRLFGDGPNPAELLEDLGLAGALSEQEAKSVLKCRVELT